MPKWSIIAAHEYQKVTRKRSFVLGTLALPLTIVGAMVLVIILMAVSADSRPLGYVDQAGVLSAVPAADMKESVELRAFADEALARAALEGGTIQAYYVLPPDYLSSRSAQLVYWDKPPVATVQSQFDDFVRANVTAALPNDVARRVREGAEITARSADGRQEISADGVVDLILPFVIGMFFIMVVLGTGTDLMSTVTDEKENRTIEVLASSVTPGQLIGGKSLGLMAVALTQIAILALTLVLVVIVGAQFLEPLRAVRLPWSLLATVTIFFLPTFALIAGMMITVGSIVNETRQGQQIAGALSMLFTIPFFFVIVFFTAPNSTLATLLTLFPTTAFLTIIMRWSMTTIPVWQMIVAWLLVTGSAVCMVWLASRLFRMGMLRYGQRLDMRSALRGLRSRQVG